MLNHLVLLQLISVKVSQIFPKLQKIKKRHFFLTRVGGLGKEGNSKSFWEKNGNKAEFSPLIYA